MIVNELAWIILPYTLLRFSGFYSLGSFTFLLNEAGGLETLLCIWRSNYY